MLELGYTTINDIYSAEEIERIIDLINHADASKETFRKSTDLFAIRQFLKEIPVAIDHIFNDNIRYIIQEIFGTNYFVTKSIYFDKPPESNWYVAYHQDLTISVDKKFPLESYGPWTVKQNQFGVQPPLNILESSFTIRIHLDDTDENNGALIVIPKSHAKGICKATKIDLTHETENIVKLKSGGVMIMKPLLLHSSKRTTNNKKRRVIHIEFCNIELPIEINWAERINLHLTKL